MTLSGLRGYIEFFERPKSRITFAFGIVSRVPLAVVSFGVLFFVESTTHSYAAAGLASGIATAAMAVTSPLYGKVADRFGQRIPILIAVVSHPAAVIAFIFIGLNAPTALSMAVGAVFLGSSVLPTGAFMRARWSSELNSTALLQTAFSLEAIADKFVWVFGPALAAIAANTIHPTAGLILSAGAGAVGLAWLIKAAPKRVGSAHETAVDSPIRLQGSVRKTTTFRPWHSAQVVTLLLVSAAMGLTFGTNDVTVVTWTSSLGEGELAGLILTAYSLGSVSGGFVMGLLPPAWSPQRMLTLATVAFGICWSILSIAPSPHWLFLLGIFAGATITPMTISTSRMMHDFVPSAVLTEALAWISLSVTAAMAVGNYVGGSVNEAVDPQAALSLLRWMAPTPLVVVLVISWARLLSVRRRTRSSS